MGLLDGRRVVVVGASAGIGRACAIEAVKTGGQVLMVARRAEKLTEVIEDAGGGIACAADLSKPGDTTKIADAARAELGEVDLLLNCAAISPLKRFMDTTFEDWEHTLATNLIGAHQLVRDLKPLMSDCGIVAMMSSEIVGRWRSGLGVYGASKAAFEAMVEQWRVEYPGLRYSTIQIGSTVPTEFGVGFDETLLTELFSEWASRGLAEATFMQVDDVGRYLVDVFAVQLPFPGVCMEHLVVRTPSGSTTDTSLMEGTASEAKQLVEG